MNKNSISEQLIRLAYIEIVLHHAEVDSAENFVENMQKELHEDQSSTQEEPLDQDTKSNNIFDRLKIFVSSHKKATIFSSLIILFVLPLLALLAFSNLNYKNKILPNTKYASIELDTDPEKALDQIKEVSSKYNLSLQFGETKSSHKPEDLGIQIDHLATLDSAKTESNKVRFFARPLEIFRSRTINTSFRIDQEKLKAFLVSQNYSDKLPEDARIEFSKELDRFAIVPEVSGRGIDSKVLTSKLEVSASTLSGEPIDLNIEDVTASISERDLTVPLDEANTLISQKITIISPNKNYTPTNSIMKDWVILTPDPENSTYKVSLNEGSQRSYIDSVISKVNRKMEKKLYATIDGSDMLIQNGTSGLQVTNAEIAKTQLINIVKSKKGGSISLDAKEEVPTTENIAASGGRWIFADISQYRVYAYEGSNMVNSFAMSSGAPETPTPPGNYSVMSKVRVKTMRGGTPGTRDYYSVPNIEWVAYFKSGGYAMHGVYWHNNFGIKNTSHGCMGMKNADAQWVYNFVDIGTPVIIVS